jgi:uncharacterized protein HemY
VIVLGARCALGERTASAAELEQLEEGLLPGGDQAGNLVLVVEVLLELDELERASRLAEGSTALAGSPVREANSALALGAVSMRRGPGHWCDAAQQFETAASLARSLGMRSGLARALLGSAELATARSQTESARKDAKASLAIFEALEMRRYALRASALLTRISTGTAPGA